MAGSVFDDVCEELRKRKLYKSDHHISKYWLGASITYLAVMKHLKSEPSGAMLLRMASRLNDHGFYDLGAKLHGYAVNQICKPNAS